jgi:tRNA 2-selenouridine synthase
MQEEFIDDFRSIVLESRPLIDVRAPVEFVKGSFSHAVNLPLMNDEERHLIGIRYKEEGNASAVALGKELIDGEPREERTAKWKSFVEEHPNAYLFCFRGGQRSEISQAWLAESGIKIPRLKGGYKAFRSFLMAESERIAKETPTLIVGGRTGSGKTLLLYELQNMIDLEGIANHRGSSFGKKLSDQPSQIDFENTLAYALIAHEALEHRHLVIEDEGYRIGQLSIPNPLFTYLKEGSLIILDTPIEERIEIIMDEYVNTALSEYVEYYGEEGRQRWCDDTVMGLSRIQKRLGSQRYDQIKESFLEAFNVQQHSGEVEGHKAWIKILLEEYYDPMYDYQIEKNELPVIFRGNKEAVLEYIRSHD